MSAEPGVLAAPVAASARVHGLDALRGGALLLGIVLHGLLPFVPGMPWVVEDAQKSALVGALCLWIHLFRMPLFMVLAGYFARMSLQRRGTRDFVRDRLKRIGLPLVVFGPVVLACVIAVAMTAAARSGMTEPPEAADGVPPILLILSPGHLWFLWTLLQLYAVVLLVRALVAGRPWADRAGAWLGDLLTRPGGVLIPTATYLVALEMTHQVIGGPTTLIPELPSTIAFLGAFLTGWFCWGVSEALPRLGRQWPVHLGIGTVLTGWIVGTAGTALNMEATVDDPAQRVVYALTVWTWCYGLLGWGTRVFTRENAAVRYLADSSYWLYIMHLPLVLLAQLLVVDQAWPWPVKGALVIGVPTVLLLLSYDVLVRPTRLGAWLNGRRRAALGPWGRGSAKRPATA